MTTAEVIALPRKTPLGRGAVADLVKKGLTKIETIEDESLAKRFFKVDHSRGEYWFKQRQETFRDGISRVYDEVKGEL